jgi:hypothetical protein
MQTCATDPIHLKILNLITYRRNHLHVFQCKELQVTCMGFKIKLWTISVTLNGYLFRSPDLFYLLTVGVEVVYFHFIALRHTPQSVGLLWTRDRPVAETST